MVKKNKAEEAFESYRRIITKGKNATAMNLITMRTRALRPQSAVNVKDVESCIVKWKSDIAYLTNVTKYERDKENEKSILMNMLPEALQFAMKPHLTKEFEGFEKGATGPHFIHGRAKQGKEADQINHRE